MPSRLILAGVEMPVVSSGLLLPSGTIAVPQSAGPGHSLVQIRSPVEAAVGLGLRPWRSQFSSSKKTTQQPLRLLCLRKRLSWEANNSSDPGEQGFLGHWRLKMSDDFDFDI